MARYGVAFFSLLCIALFVIGSTLTPADTVIVCLVTRCHVGFDSFAFPVLCIKVALLLSLVILLISIVMAASSKQLLWFVNLVLWTLIIVTAGIGVMLSSASGGLSSTFSIGLILALQPLATLLYGITGVRQRKTPGK